jgi:hypothetical protein
VLIQATALKNKKSKIDKKVDKKKENKKNDVF